MKRQFAAWVAALAGVGIFAATAAAQSTDGYHRIQILPVVVDSASFTDRLVFRNPTGQTATITVTYYPAQGTSQASPLDCGTVDVFSNRQRTFDGLRALCPQLAPGSQFGFLRATQAGPANQPFSVYSRVSNSQGNGFSVEGFPAHTFTSADASVTGLRRSAASASAPAFQSNCFMALMDNVGAAASTPTTVSYLLFSESNVPLGQGSVQLQPGQMVRLLDIFDAAGAPFADYDNGRILFTESGDGDPGVIAFCTVQDNTSFGADFRIAKQEYGAPTAASGSGLAAQDQLALRASEVDGDIPLPTGVGAMSARPFSIAPGASSNSHLIHFRHPDLIGCDIVDSATGVRAPMTNRLVHRLLAEDGMTVLAGGNGITGFDNLYLGDKQSQGGGANTRYLLEVESAETNLASTRPYRLRCASGSGHTRAELVRVGGPDLF